MNLLFLVISLFVGALVAVTVAVMVCLAESKGNPPTNWRGEDPYEDD
ncbi:MAG: hypothetical protein M0R38_12170 [Bacteroidia bacterium]|nr:hypothetical protein [Bacteroidia bacterium]